MDNHIQEILNSSFRSLTQITLISCSCLRKFDYFSRCIELTSLSITNNEYIFILIQFYLLLGSTGDLQMLPEAQKSESIRLLVFRSEYFQAYFQIGKSIESNPQ